MLSYAPWYLESSRYYTGVSIVVFSSEECDKIRNQLLETKLFEAKVNVGDNSLVDNQYRNTNAVSLDPFNESTRWIFQRINDAILHVNKTYFELDIISLQTLQFLEYNVGQFYKTHVDSLDIAPKNEFRKISLSIQLTDPKNYKGGDLRLYCEDPPNVCEKEKGLGIFFPSYLPHEVMPVTEGVRHCLVGWVTGPKWR